MPEIHSIDDNDINLESVDLIPAGQCQESSVSLGQSQEVWVSSITQVLDEVAGLDPRPPGYWSPPEKERKFFSHGKWQSVQPQHVEPPVQVPPEELSAFEAFHWKGDMGVDLRPHIYDPILQKYLLYHEKKKPFRTVSILFTYSTVR